MKLTTQEGNSLKIKKTEKLTMSKETTHYSKMKQEKQLKANLISSNQSNNSNNTFGVSRETSSPSSQFISSVNSPRQIYPFIPIAVFFSHSLGPATGSGVSSSCLTSGVASVCDLLTTVLGAVDGGGPPPKEERP